ncbi:hypothetical protein HX071_08570 [Myroides marinus]|nr:hypothetical protein [Myroides marinus]MDM1502257.1 hypothetical protein [Myroides marinus]
MIHGTYNPQSCEPFSPPYKVSEFGFAQYLIENLNFKVKFDGKTSK